MLQRNRYDELIADDGLDRNIEQGASNPAEDDIDLTRSKGVYRRGGIQFGYRECCALEIGPKRSNHIGKNCQHCRGDGPDRQGRCATCTSLENQAFDALRLICEPLDGGQNRFSFRRKRNAAL